MKALASWIPMVMQIGGKCDGQREGHSEGMVVNDIALGKERSVAIVAALFFRVVLCNPMAIEACLSSSPLHLFLLGCKQPSSTRNP